MRPRKGSIRQGLHGVRSGWVNNAGLPTRAGDTLGTEEGSEASVVISDASQQPWRSKDGPRIVWEGRG